MAIQGRPQSSRASLSLGGRFARGGPSFFHPAKAEAVRGFTRNQMKAALVILAAAPGVVGCSARATHGELPKKSVSPATLSCAVADRLPRSGSDAQSTLNRRGGVGRRASP
jgi:hypothetical protein